VKRYNKEAVDKAIKQDPRIKGKEAKLIHGLLKGGWDELSTRKATEKILKKLERRKA